MPVETAAKTAIEVAVIRKATSRLLPFLMLACFIAFVDRVTSGFVALGPIFALSSEWPAGTAAATGLAQIDAVGNLAGFVDRFLIDAIQEATYGYAPALLLLMLIAAVGCIAVLLLGGGQRAGWAATVSPLY